MRPRADLLEVRHQQRLHPRLRARLAVEQQLIDDASARGWAREVERHHATRRRINQLLADLGEEALPASGCAGGVSDPPAGTNP
jgi:hypothetical protein